MKFFTEVTEQDMKAAFSSFPPGIKVLARKYKYLFAYHLNMLIKEHRGSLRVGVVTDNNWLVACLKTAQMQGLPSTAVTPVKTGNPPTYGEDLAREYADKLQELTGFLGERQHPKSRARKTPSFMKLVVDNT